MPKTVNCFPLFLELNFPRGIEWLFVSDLHFLDFFSFIDLYSSFSPEMPESKKEEQRENTFTPVIGILSQVRKFFKIIGQRNMLNV